MPPPQRNFRSLWFFLALVVLAIVAVSGLAWYNLGLQLKPEQLAAARQLWQQKGLRDYRLIYTVKRGIDLDPDHYVVMVRGGKIVSAQFNGNVEPEERLHHYGVPALFKFIDDDLRLDANPGQPRTYSRAMFDPDNGHVRKYVRRVMGGKQRLEISIEGLQPLAPESH